MGAACHLHGERGLPTTGKEYAVTAEGGVDAAEEGLLGMPCCHLHCWEVVVTLPTMGVATGRMVLL